MFGKHMFMVFQGYIIIYITFPPPQGRGKNEKFMRGEKMKKKKRGKGSKKGGKKNKKGGKVKGRKKEKEGEKRGKKGTKCGKGG